MQVCLLLLLIFFSFSFFVTGSKLIDAAFEDSCWTDSSKYKSQRSIAECLQHTNTDGTATFSKASPPGNNRKHWEDNPSLPCSNLCSFSLSGSGRRVDKGFYSFSINRLGKQQYKHLGKTFWGQKNSFGKATGRAFSFFVNEISYKNMCKSKPCLPMWFEEKCNLNNKWWYFFHKNLKIKTTVSATDGWCSSLKGYREQTVVIILYQFFLCLKTVCVCWFTSQ